MSEQILKTLHSLEADVRDLLFSYEQDVEARCAEVSRHLRAAIYELAATRKAVRERKGAAA